MKTKRTILGVALSVILVAVLVLAAAPVSAGTIAFSTVTTPNPINQQLQERTNVDAFAVAPDGVTMFAYSNQGGGSLGAVTNGGTAVWSTTLPNVGLQSALLTHTADATGSVYVQFTPIQTLTLTDFDEATGTGADPTDPIWGFDHKKAAAGTTNGPQIELKFEDPDSTGWLEATIVPLQSTVGGGTWVTEVLDDDDAVGFGGNDALGADFDDWSLGTNIDGLLAAVDSALTGSTTAAAWVLTRVRIELWDANTQSAYIDDVIIDGNTYAMEGAWSVEPQSLYKSSDAGVTWTTTAIGTGLEGATAGGEKVVGIAISPNYADDGTLVVATGTRVFRSANYGVSFGEVSTSLLTGVSGADAVDVFITSVDLAMYYTGGSLAILVGTKDVTDQHGGGVFLGRLDTWTWTDLDVGNVDAGANTVGAGDVYAVAFSPNHTLDAQVLAVVSSSTGTAAIGAGTTWTADRIYLVTKFAENAWGADVLDASFATTVTEEEMRNGSAVIAFADDYEWSAMNRVLVGITSADTDDTNGDDVYRVHGGLPGGASLAYDLQVNGTSVETNVYSIAVSGGISGATVIVGQQGSTTVKRTSDPTVSVVTWSSSIKSPIGDASNPNTNLVMTANGTVYAATNGANSALSISDDGAITFNGLALIDVSDTAMLRYQANAIIDASTMFLTVHDNTDTDMTDPFDIGETQHLFKTTDGGTTWQRVLFHLSTGTEGLSIIGASPDYATDNTVYIAQNDSRLWRTTDGGGRWVGLAAPSTISALTVIDGSNYFTGHTNGRIYKNGHWNYGTADAADDPVSIAISPDFATDDTVFVGTDDGDVFYSTNASATVSVLYTQLGTDEGLGNAGNILVTPDPGYAANSTLYAASDDDAEEGVYRWVIGTSITWTQMDVTVADSPVDLDTEVTGLVTSPDGTLYAASSDAGGGILRQLNPTNPSAYFGLSGWEFEAMTTLLPTNAQLQSLAYIPGSNTLYAIVDNLAASTTYPHGWLLTTITDTFSITPVLIGPDEGTETSTTVGFSWEAITAPAGTTVTYTVEVSRDAAFADDFLSPTTTTGTAYTVSSLIAGTQYWWRIYVDGAPLNTQRASRSFIVKLGTAAQSSEVSSPAPGSTSVSLRPNFQWTAVAGATGYRLELADNAAFADATKVLLDTNVWSLTADLEYSTTYYWRVKAISATTESSWSTGVFTTEAEPAPPVVAPAPDITVQAPPAPQVTVQAPPAPQVTVEAPTLAPTTITPAWIYAIIIVGAVLVIAVIVLIVRTRRVV